MHVDGLVEEVGKSIEQSKKVKTAYVYFNNTASYALAYAIYLGVEKISIFGCDYLAETVYASRNSLTIVT